MLIVVAARSIASRSVVDLFVLVCTQEHLHLEACLSTLPRAHPASEEGLVDAKAVTLIHDLNLHALRLLAVRVVL